MSWNTSHFCVLLRRQNYTDTFLVTTYFLPGTWLKKILVTSWQWPTCIQMMLISDPVLYIVKLMKWAIWSTTALIQMISSTLEWRSWWNIIPWKIITMYYKCYLYFNYQLQNQAWKKLLKLQYWTEFQPMTTVIPASVLSTTSKLSTEYCHTNHHFTVQDQRLKNLTKIKTVNLFHCQQWNWFNFN